MSETLSSLKQSARNLLSETGTEFFDEPALADHINRCSQMMFMDVPECFPAGYSSTTVPGCPTYLLPERLVIPKATFITLTSGVSYRLNYWPPAIIDQYRQYAARRPSQNLYMNTYRQTTLGTCVDFLFEPSTYMRFTVFGYQTPKKLVNDDDIADIAERDAHVLIRAVYVSLKTMDEENQETVIGDKLYQQLISRIKARRMKKQLDQINMTRPMRGFSRGRFPWLG